MSAKLDPTTDDQLRNLLVQRESLQRSLQYTETELIEVEDEICALLKDMKGGLFLEPNYKSLKVFLEMKEEIKNRNEWSAKKA